MVTSPSPSAIVLEARTFLAQYVLGKQEYEFAKFDIVADTAERLLFRLRAEVYGEKLNQTYHDLWFTHEFSFPANVWQHAKERFAPTWFTSRWPVRYNVHMSRQKRSTRSTDWALFPELKNRYSDDLGRVVLMTQYEDGEWE